ncbi:hypothetical protein SAMN06296427_102197 [Moheibacter sediminis]|uniref:Uncharacterized protein n=1 Tax=Moheibacter sediminis TaxID=1434700 RepID=A0A1W1Z4N9_9FLAO|nr:hypothetical protein SAMN06296427_102197 [Moheibacter sediminis]
MRLMNLLIPAIMTGCSIVFSQEKNTEKEDYIVIDLSKSHPNNRTLDYLYYLTINSAEVDLPLEIIEFLESIPDGNDSNLHTKYTYQRTEILKVIYNERISPEDKRFLCNHHLKITDSQGVNPIHPLLQKYIDRGSL